MQTVLQAGEELTKNALKIFTFGKDNNYAYQYNRDP